MANYYRVSPKFWPDSRGWSDRERIVALYLLTNRHRTTEGLYHLPKGYVQTDLDYPQRAVGEAFDALEALGFISYDDDAQVVLVVNALKYQAPNTEAQIKGAIARLTLVPRTPLASEFLVACERHCPPLASATRVALGWHSSTQALAQARTTKASSTSERNGARDVEPDTEGVAS